MNKHVILLNDDDVIQPDDYVRDMLGDPYGDRHATLKWIKVKDALGECWFGKTVEEFNARLGEGKWPALREFARGEMPERKIASPEEKLV